ncbi:hypothetical protein NUW54_g1919 [Trametes sanguinea]|uniref:Uncharacterized protein n=1 Tax=Trametes sanguinea TaxID=158606 RepID=A0ACC1Q6P6_9APHY|nr:hypothetical protein NUW54_g1919 [Trametes sanguinea]
MWSLPCGIRDAIAQLRTTLLSSGPLQKIASWMAVPYIRLAPPPLTEWQLTANMYALPRDDSGELDSAREAAWMNRTFGSVLVGCYLGFIIYGLNLHQAARYYKTFPKDHIYLKLLVSTISPHYIVRTNETRPPSPGCVRIVLGDMAHSVRDVYLLPLLGRQLLQFVGPPCWLFTQDSITSRTASPAVRGTIDYKLSNVRRSSSSTHTHSDTMNRFFMRRVYLLVGRRSKILVAVVVLFLVAELGLATASSAETSDFSRSCTSSLLLNLPSTDRFIKTTFKAYANVTWIISVAFGMAAVADAILTTILICALRRCRTGMQRTDSLLDVLILYAISTGLLTCVFDLATFLVTLIQPSDFVWFAVNIVATKVYPASLLAAYVPRVCGL